VSYSEKDGQVILAMSREDYEFLLVCLGLATSEFLRTNDLEDIKTVYSLLNRLNEGNPNYTPYRTEKAAK
jgi:hypothetical protein